MQQNLLSRGNSEENVLVFLMAASLKGRNHHHIYLLQTALFCKQHLSAYIFLNLVQSDASKIFYLWKKKTKIWLI